jgi:hypothetical protein
MAPRYPQCSQYLDTRYEMYEFENRCAYFLVELAKKASALPQIG